MGHTRQVRLVVTITLTESETAQAVYSSIWVLSLTWLQGAILAVRSRKISSLELDLDSSYSKYFSRQHVRWDDERHVAILEYSEGVMDKAKRKTRNKEHTSLKKTNKIVTYWQKHKKPVICSIRSSPPVSSIVLQQNPRCTLHSNLPTYPVDPTHLSFLTSIPQLGLFYFIFLPFLYIF